MRPIRKEEYAYWDYNTDSEYEARKSSLKSEMIDEIDEIDNNTPVYPVEIKRTQLWTPRNAPIRYRYTVMNGNHRITASAIDQPVQ
mgnify:CR=1 FL=1